MSDLTDQLSAYLDGELDAAATRAVEERLSSDESAREELARLERAWRLLDGLPRSAAHPSFAATTVEMIALDTAGAVERQPGGTQSGWWGMYAAAVVVAMLAGYWIVSGALPDPNRQLLADLPVVEHLDIYRQVPDLSFARSLRDAKLFATGDMVPAPLSEPLDAEHRAARVAALSAEEKFTLLEKNERFLQMSLPEQERLRTLDRELTASADRDSLWTVMNRYHAWLDGRSAGERAELSQLDPAARIERIRRLQAGDVKRKHRQLSASDLKVLTDWIEQRVTSRMTPAHRAEYESLPPNEKRRALNRELWQRSLLFEAGKTMPVIEDSELVELYTRLSPEAQKQLAQLPPMQRKFLFFDWVRQAVGMSGDRPDGDFGNGVPRERLQQFLEHELTPSEREQLLSLPAEEFQTKLRRLYFQRMLGGPGPKQPPTERREKPRGDGSRPPGKPPKPKDL